MNKIRKRNLHNIRRAFERKTGTSLMKPTEEANSTHRSLRPAMLAAMLGGLCLLLAAFTWPLFSPLGGDALTLSALYEGDGIVAIQVENRSDKKLEFQPQTKLFHWLTGEEVPQLSNEILFEGTTISPGSTQTMTIDLSNAYDMEELEQSRQTQWYYLLLTNHNFVFGQVWKCSVFFGDEGEKPEESDVPAYALESEVLDHIQSELRFYFEEDYIGVFAANPMNYEYLQKTEEYLLRCGEKVVPSINPGLMARPIPDGVILDETVAQQKQYALTGQTSSLHDAFGKYVGSGEHESFQVLDVCLPAYQGSDDQAWSLPLVYLATYEKAAIETGEECAFIYGQLVRFRELAPYLVYEDEYFVCFNVTHLFYTDLEAYVENVVAMNMAGNFKYHYFDEQAYKRVENVYNYYKENLSIVSRDEFLNTRPNCIIENTPDAKALIEQGMGGIITSNCDIEKIEITIMTQEDGKAVYTEDIIPEDLSYYDLANAADATAAIQSLEKGVYILDVAVWIDSEIMGYRSLWSQVFVTGNASWPGLW